MSVAARFFVSAIEKQATLYTVVKLVASSRGQENKSWAKYTPSGTIQMSISPDTDAGRWFEEHVGQDVALTFDHIPGQEKKTTPHEA